MNSIDQFGVEISLADAALAGDVWLPPGAPGIVLFAHGSGSSRLSPRNRYVAGEIVKGGIGTLLFDLLTREEERRDQLDASLRFDIGLLTRRLAGATHWLRGEHWAGSLPVGYFGASTGAAAALAASVDLDVRAVVSRGGRPDLAGNALPHVRAPTLLIVGSNDPVVLDLNRQALARMDCEARLEIVPGATHLFEEPGTLEMAAGLATDWFRRWFAPSQGSA
jgi:putative phosphoribosyl transferase